LIGYNHPRFLATPIVKEMLQMSKILILWLKASLTVGIKKKQSIYYRKLSSFQVDLDKYHQDSTDSLPILQTQLSQQQAPVKTTFCLPISIQAVISQICKQQREDLKLRAYLVALALLLISNKRVQRSVLAKPKI
jgi:hypothetical protein